MSKPYPILPALMFCCVLLNACRLHAETPPNILFILVDDMGWSDPSEYGNPLIETPNIERLAVEGMKFTQAYADPVCAPSRAAIQTGQYCARLQMTGVPNGHRRPYAKLKPPEIRWQLPLEYITLAESFQRAGYVSGIFGKWHLGYDPDHQPEDQGYVMPSERSLEGPYAGRVEAWVNQNPHKNIGRQVMQSVRFIEQNAGMPFFCFVSYNMVHTALSARESLIDKYKEKVAAQRTVIHPEYAAMCEVVDETVAIFDEVLSALGLRENTLLIFASDNGGVIEERGFLFHGYEALVTHNWPLRSEKGSLYEGGIRVPMIIRWPGRVEAGAVCDAPVHLLDLYPTLHEILDIPVPDQQIVDGLSFASRLTSGKGPGPEPRQNPEAGLQTDRAIFWHYPHYHHSRPASAILSGDYKLIKFYETGECELYHLGEDIGEQYEISERQPEIAARLTRRLEDWLISMNAGMPVENPDYDYSKELLWGPRPSWEEIRSSGVKHGL